MRYLVNLVFGLLLVCSAQASIYNSASGNRYIYSSDPGASGQYTMCAWIRRNQGTGAAMQFFGRSDSADWAIGKSAAEHLVLTTGGTARITGTATIALNTWYFVCYTRDGAGTPNHTFYIGTETTSMVQDATAPGSWDPTGTVETAWGRNGFSGTPWLGYIDYARIWNTALTSAECEAERFSSTYAKTANIWGNWRMQDAAPTTQIVEAVSAHNAGVVGTAWVNGSLDPTLPVVPSPIAPMFLAWPR